MLISANKLATSSAVYGYHSN